MIGLPAIVVFLATVAIVVFSLTKMAGEVNRIESTVTGRSVTAGIKSTLRGFGESHKDYAVWDDIVRHLYGTADRDWVTENIASSTLFDTFYLIDESGNEALGYRNGEPASATAANAFSPSLASMIAELPKDGTTYDVRTGIVRGVWGLAVVAVGPMVPASADFPNPPQRSRYMVIGKRFDDAAVGRLGEDLLIDRLRLVDPAASEPHKIDITDPNGTVVGALAWTPGRLGSQAQASVNPAVLPMLLLVGLTMAFLVVLALRGWKEVQKRELLLDTALTNMSQGLCMFDAEEKLVIFNARFAEIYGVSPEQITPGMTTRELMALAFGPGKVSDKDPEGTLALQQSFIREGTGGSGIERLTDGRSVAIAHRPMLDGGFVATFEDITQRLLVEARVKHLAHHDSLTDLLNRVAFYEQMGTVLGRLRRTETVAVLSLDLDHFKSVNDTLGHPVGDLLLQAAAGRMRSCVRGEDIVARVGGDEFAVVQVPSDQAQDVIALATRLIEVIGAPYDLNGHQVVVGVSIGIALAPSDSNEPDVLVKNADLALYRAKADGGGVYRFFEAEMDARMQARRVLELDLRRAIVTGEFELYYQPIIDVKTGEITSCEALVRWHHPERGMIAPLDFIPLAEATGLIVPIGEWVLRQACSEAAGWPNHITVAVNLSPAQFKSRSLVPTVVSALATSGLAAGRLELEITELVLLQDNESAFAVLHQLRELGVKIAMDDFGTGYSSLGYLRSFPFDRIKIDQSFIRDLPAKKASLAIVRAVVGLSGSLDIKTTAEGVETAEQLASLTSEGCNEFQGFLFSEPRPAAEIARMFGKLDPRAKAVA
jgi:diguanylate cyclase (GGDEF)-like protein